jgi:hypothetical protein
MLAMDDDDLDNHAASLPSGEWLDYMAHRLCDLDCPTPSVASPTVSKPCLRLLDGESYQDAA